jgi:hypothetical protein
MVCKLACSPKQFKKGILMKKSFLFLMIFLAGVGVHGQNIVGKIFLSAEATGLFGPPSVSIPIETSTLNEMLKLTTDYIMFRIDKDSLTILDNKRNAIYPKNAVVKETDIYKYASVSLVSKLLIGGKESVTKVELRNFGILSISNGEFVLEWVAPCPPDCP